MANQGPAGCRRARPRRGSPAPRSARCGRVLPERQEPWPARAECAASGADRADGGAGSGRRHRRRPCGPAGSQRSCSMLAMKRWRGRGSPRGRGAGSGRPPGGCPRRGPAPLRPVLPCCQRGNGRGRRTRRPLRKRPARRAPGWGLPAPWGWGRPTEERAHPCRQGPRSGIGRFSGSFPGHPRGRPSTRRPRELSATGRCPHARSARSKHRGRPPRSPGASRQYRLPSTRRWPPDSRTLGP